MQLQINDMTLTGTPYELAIFVKHYKSKLVEKTVHPHIPPWYWKYGAVTTGDPPPYISTTTGLDSWKS